jgi:hypothetical protein
LGTLKGENAPNYKKVVGKSQVHRWMEVHYGKPQICEMEGCEGKSVWFDWAKKEGMEYERNRDNFLRLCRTCHRRYDLTPKLKLQIEKNLWWNKGTKPPGKLFKKGHPKYGTGIQKGYKYKFKGSNHKGEPI